MTRLVHRNRSLLAATGSLALAASVLMGSPPTSADPAPGWRTVASGLDNPRLLSFSRDGSLYVAEAGRGGSGPCIPAAEGGETCFGRSGAITRIRGHRQTRVLDRLPSLAAPDGSSALGPADVVVRNGYYTVSIGLGQDPAVRAGLPGAARRLGTLLTGSLGSRPHVLANLASFEAAKDPDGGVPDSDPTGFVRAGAGYVVTDAGGNDLLRVRRDGRISVLAVFRDRLVPAPPFLPPGDIPMQAVPTSVIRGSDGAFYVSQLTGFPFPSGAARIFRVVPGHAPTVYARGLTNVTDLAWARGHLYAVQIAGEGGLLAAVGLPMGSLVRIDSPSTHSTVADQLPAPYGVAIRGHHAYVTTCTVCAGGGEVVRIPLG